MTSEQRAAAVESSAAAGPHDEQFQVPDDQVDPGRLYSQPGEKPTSFEQILYRDLVVEGRGLLETAGLYGVASSDVLASKERVAAWLVASIAPSKLSPEDQRAHIQRVVIDRMEYLYSEAMGAWRESRQESTVTRKPNLFSSEGTMHTTATRPRGSLLWTAARIVTALGKFQLACVAEKERAERERAERAQCDAAETSPPVRACSRIEGEAVAGSAVEHRGVAASAVPAITNGDSAGRLNEPVGPAERRLHPVQASPRGGNGRTTTSSADGPPRQPR